jgi:membrane-bound ClpP family serine protease
MTKYLIFLLLVIPSVASADAGVSMDAIISFENTPLIAFIGFALIAMEFILPTKGVLGLVGIVLFVIGTFSLADATNPNFRLSYTEIILLNLLVVGTCLFIGYRTIRGYTLKNSAVTSWIDQEATVIDWNENTKRVELNGAVWNAVANDLAIVFSAGQKVIVISQDNLILTVKAKGE